MEVVGQLPSCGVDICVKLSPREAAVHLLEHNLPPRTRGATGSAGTQWRQPVGGVL
jgi:hypothetical protein